MQFVPVRIPDGGLCPTAETSLSPTKPAAARSACAPLKREDKGRGVSHVVTEIPYGVQKSKLIEKIAELLTARKLPLLKDIRDESADDIRVVLEPRAGTVDAAVLMEQLFRLSDLEVRVPLNLNVLDKGTVPRVMSLAGGLKAWLEHRKVVLVRRTQHRLEHIARRLEVLDGYIVPFLNLDEVIPHPSRRTIPKRLMKRFQAQRRAGRAILTCGASLRKLEEIELRTEHKILSEEKIHLEALLASDRKQWGEITGNGELKKIYGHSTPLGNVVPTSPTRPDADLEEVSTAAMIERSDHRDPLRKGWIRGDEGPHQRESMRRAFKAGDRLNLFVHARPTDKLLLLTTAAKS